jgi:hypothetical protein
MKKLLLAGAAVLSVNTAYAEDSPPMGWVYSRFLQCADSVCHTAYTSVGADGVNVRQSPNGLPTHARAIAESW